MASFPDRYSTMLIDDASRLNDQDMRLAVRPKVEPVSDNEVESFISELKSPYICTICSKPFIQKGNLNQHLMIHSGERPFMCDICQKAFSRNSNLNRHKLSHVRLTIRPKVEPVSDNEVEPVSDNEVKSFISNLKSPYMCSICGKSFLRKGNLKIHLVIHSEKRPFVCDICQKAFSRKTVFNRHKLSHLKIPSQHKCDSCDEAFSRKSDLLKHKKIHKSSKQDKCSEMKPALYDQETRVSDIEIPPLKIKSFECGICHKTLLQRTDLKRHSTTPSKTTTAYKCDQCGKDYFSKFLLKSHKLIAHQTPHLKKKPFECEICRKTFMQKTDLKRHSITRSKTTTSYKC